MSSQLTRSNKKCEVCGVRRTAGSKVILCNFPLDPTRCRHWVKAVGNPDFLYLPIEKLHELKSICNLHFTRESFNKQGNRLLKTAVPTLRLCLQPLADELFNDFPLHMSSYCEKKENFSKIEPLSSNAITVSSGVIPVASTTRAPIHLTCERNFDTTTQRADHCYSTGNNNDSSQRLAENDAEPKIGVPPKSNQSRPTSDKGGSVVGRKQKSNDEEKFIKKYTYGIDIEETPDATTTVYEENSTGIDITYDMSADNYVDLDEITDSNEPVLSADLSEPNVDEAECNEENVEYISDSEHCDSPGLASDSDHEQEIVGRSSLHDGVVCNACRSPITGFRYTCLQCEDFDLCSQCEANESHAHHYVLRVPEPRPYVELQAVLSRLREELAMVTAVSGADPSKVPNLLEDDEIKIEVKMEPDEVPDPLSAELLAPQLENRSEEHQTDYTLSLPPGLLLDESESLIYLDEKQAAKLFKQYTQHEQEHLATVPTQSQSINDDNLTSIQVLQLPTGLPQVESDTVLYLDNNQALELLTHYSQHEQEPPTQSVKDYTTLVLQNTTEDKPQDESDTVVYLDENQVLELLGHSQLRGRKRPGPSLQPPRRETRPKVVCSSRTNETVSLPHLVKRDAARR